jgi:hypothetical protein
MSPDKRKAIAIKISHMLPEQEFTYFCTALAALSETTQTDILTALDNLIEDDGIVHIKYSPENKDDPILKEIIEILDGWMVWTDPTEITSTTEYCHIYKL